MSVDLGRVRILGADAVGQPGQRRFRLFAQSSRGSLVVWMEKEQLNSLSIALDRALAQLSEGQVLRTEARAGGRLSPQTMPADFPSPPTYEFQAGQIGLNYDESDDLFLLGITPFEIMLQGEEPVVQLREEDEVTFLFNLHEAQNLSSAITSVVGAGRPVCPLCGTPLDGGPHACVKQNGHREILQIEAEDEDE
ncbi:MAG TPA: DUF3090 family protein [Ktedonobacteraceae bacterium]|jgi:uncharacterized repeat protein (TIGR03847 family)|nr:DUF3090 family protein [Ktedonobacteraceae bacterium]